MTKKMKQLKEAEDRLAGNLCAVGHTMKEVRDALELLGFTEAAKRLDLSLYGALGAARAGAFLLRRTKPSLDKNPDVKRLKNIESAARDWTNAISARRRANVRHGHPDFEGHMKRITLAGRALRAALGDR